VGIPPDATKSSTEGEATMLTFLEMQVQRKRHSLWSSFDIVACMVATKFLLLYYAHKIPLSTVMLIYGTRYSAKEWNPLSS
jgi:hypothetical protein